VWFLAVLEEELQVLVMLFLLYSHIAYAQVGSGNVRDQIGRTKWHFIKRRHGRRSPLGYTFDLSRLRQFVNTLAFCTIRMSHRGILVLVNLLNLAVPSKRILDLASLDTL